MSALSPHAGTETVHHAKPSHQHGSFGAHAILPGRQVLAVEDSATKITELVPLADKSPEIIGTRLTTEWICKYGLPNIVSTAFDQETTNLI